MDHENGYSRPTTFHHMTLAAGRVMFAGEDIGEPAEAARFMVELGAAWDDQAIVDCGRTRYQARVDDLHMIADPLDALARAAEAH